LGKTYLEHKEFQNAVDMFSKYLSYNKNSDIAYALRADAYLNMNYIIEAEEDIKNALKIEENISYLLIEAKILYYKGNYDEARQKLLILSRNVQTSEVYKYLGLCDYAQNDYRNALLNLDKAIILSDDDKELNSTYNNVKMMLDKK
jgi:tetratricopeptide (TPR) repeat protein